MEDDFFTNIPHTQREHKGQSIIAFPEEYVVVDLETTGYSPLWDEIIEIGAIRIKNGIPIETFQQLVKPDYEISPFVTSLTGITNEMLENAPPIASVLPQFKKFLGKSIIVGQNTSFDVNFLYDSYTKVFNEPLSQDFINIMRYSKKLYPDMEHHRLIDIATICGIQSGSFHRALNDCEYTYKCFESMREQIKNMAGGTDSFIQLFKKRKKSNRRASAKNLSELTTKITEFDETHPLYKKRCVFTGKLSRFTRIEAAQIVLNFGGFCEDRITKRTNFLIMGSGEYTSSVKDGKSNKRKKAEKYISNGQDITILSEDSFYDMIEE